MNHPRKLDTTLPIFGLLEKMETPRNGELHLWINTWKRDNWVTKKYVFMYHAPENILEYHLAIYEHGLTYGMVDPYDYVDDMLEKYVVDINNTDDIISCVDTNKPEPIYYDANYGYDIDPTSVTDPSIVDF